MRLTNNSGVALSMAVYLATDDYDYEPGIISATRLLKPTRQVILGQRLPPEHQTMDISSLVKSKGGSSIHDGIERAWKTNYAQAMLSLGYSTDVIDSIRINPDDDEDLTDKIPVYIERRSYKEIDGVTVSGKFDFIGQGRLEDFKTTGTYTYTKKTKEEDYRLQGSIYRWLNSDIVTEDYIAIQFYFTDWKAYGLKTEKNYPPCAVYEHRVPLMTLDETETFVRGRLAELARFENTPEMGLPLCTPKELWMGDSVWKYYKNPEKTARATANFGTAVEANARKAKDGNVGIVKEVKAQAKACNFCSAAPICSQYQTLLEQGLIQTS